MMLLLSFGRKQARMPSPVRAIFSQPDERGGRHADCRKQRRQPLRRPFANSTGVSDAFYLDALEKGKAS